MTFGGLKCSETCQPKTKHSENLKNQKAKKFWGLKIRVDHWIETCRKIYDILGGIFCWDTAEIRLRNCLDMSAVHTFSISFRGLSYAGFPIFSKKNIPHFRILSIENAFQHSFPRHFCCVFLIWNWTYKETYQNTQFHRTYNYIMRNRLLPDIKCKQHR